uniref:deoxynucleoside triphosphate triphosphohydrolase SAMHD1-like n=1 Tax=Maylandia zebra TaxID=106582 RepID=UPI000D304C4E|nr:deoxynucleoside triphosphate triphosphohydrolase SAMHD1-like [Maylandia zebra]
MFNPEADPEHKDWKHADASLEMFDHLVVANSLAQEMERYGLILPPDLTFIKEMIKPLKIDDAEWPYEGRDENKSFLYEIVSNKQNGIDVDKFDYFARDCHHLGIRNNFDHQRFIMFARVCDVNGRKHICSRDKEVANLYDMFHTRNSLHRRAYQHRVTKSVEIMIKDALLKADQYILTKGSGGTTFCLSKAKTDMEAYTKLTDQMIERILHPCSCSNEFTPSPLEEARMILQRIMSRDLYQFMGETKLKKEDQEEIKKMKDSLENELVKVIPKDNFEIIVVTLDYGMKNKDPINTTYFYTKANPTEAFKISREQVSKLLPVCFAEKILRVYCKNSASLRDAKFCFQSWCHENDFLTESPVLLGGMVKYVFEPHAHAVPCTQYVPFRKLIRAFLSCGIRKVWEQLWFIPSFLLPYAKAMLWVLVFPGEYPATMRTSFFMMTRHTRAPVALVDPRWSFCYFAGGWCCEQDLVRAFPPR